MAILKVKRADGTFAEIPSIVGRPGDDGVGIQSVEQTKSSTEDGGENVFTVTLTDGSKTSFSVYNGGKGNKGDQGEPGVVDYGVVTSEVSTHNTSTAAHNDIRLLIEGLTSRLNALADSDDETLDQMAELVAYIKYNRGLIEQVTTNKVNVSDIIDNLETNVANKPLSAAQGVALKALIDAIPSWAKAASKPSYTAAEVGARPSTWMPTAADVGARPNTWMPTASDVGARPNTWTPSASDVGALPIGGGTMTGKIIIGQGNNQGIDLGDNGVIGRWRSDLGNWHTFLGLYQGACILAHASVPCRIRGSEARPKYNDNDMALESDIPNVPSWAMQASKPGYTADEVGARPSTWTPSASDVGAVPTSRTVNGKPLSSDINLAASDVGARPSTWTPSASDVGALPTTGGTMTGDVTFQNLQSIKLVDAGLQNNAPTFVATFAGNRCQNGLSFSSVESLLPPKETWTFTLEDGTEVTKAVYIG